MQLGINVGYSGAQMGLPIEHIQEMERIGYSSVWTAEAYGSDAITPLAYIAALTTKIRLGTGIMQIPGRTPAMCAMTSSTLDALSNGRMLVGLGLSGPQVVEGWHGVPYGKPAARTREYIEILRKIWAREAPVSYSGQEYQVPYTGPGATGLGKPLKSILHGRQLPVYLATMGPVNIRATPVLRVGWLELGVRQCDRRIAGKDGPNEDQQNDREQKGSANYRRTIPFESPPGALVWTQMFHVLAALRDSD